MASGAGAVRRSGDNLAEKIEYLFATVRRPDGREHTYEDVETGTSGKVSGSYIWKLRHGKNSNPSLDVIEALAGFFQVPETYFFGQAIDSDADAREAAAVAALLRDDGMRGLLEKCSGLSPAARQAVSELVDHLRSIEGSA